MKARSRIAPTTLAVLTTFCLNAAPAAVGEPHSDQSPVEVVAEQMLQAIGGRLAWAELRNTINGSEQYRAVEPTTVYSVITIDFERPRLRIETTAEDLYLVRVINGESHWRMTRDGEIEDGRPDTVKADRRWYAAHLYRTLHRIASRDPTLRLQVSEDGRLEVHESDERLMWLRLDVEGEPYAFGVRDDEIGSLTGPWNFVRDGIHHPSWVSSHDGTWRAAVKALSVNVTLRDSIFDRPTESR